MSPVRDEPRPQPTAISATLTPEQRRTLADQNLQDQYRQAYALQQARRSCPGCGESSLAF